jgi:hypothetical protein
MGWTLAVKEEYVCSLFENVFQLLRLSTSTQYIGAVP